MASKARVHGGELHSDGSGAENEQAMGKLALPEQRFAGEHMLTSVDAFHIGQDRGRPGIDKDFFPFEENFLFIPGNDLYRIVGRKGCRTVIQGNVGMGFYMFVILVPQE